MRWDNEPTPNPSQEGKRIRRGRMPGPLSGGVGGGSVPEERRRPERAERGLSQAAAVTQAKVPWDGPRRMWVRTRCGVGHSALRGSIKMRLAGRRTWDTRDEFCASVSFMSAGVLLRRPAHTKTSCVGFRETQGQRVQIPSFHSVFPFSPERKSFSSVAASLLNASAKVLLVC